MKSVPEVAETKASGRVAALYADIRAVTGVPLVNLVYRHMATEVKVLDWAWSVLRPRIASGALPSQAAILHQRIDRLVANWSTHGAPPLAIPDAVVADLIRAYNTTNSLNLLGLTCLLGLGRQSPEAGSNVVSPAAPDAGSHLTLPDLPAWDALTPALLLRVERLNRMGETGQPLITASLYRHLALWPSLLPQIEAHLTPLDSHGKLQEGRMQARLWATELAPELTTESSPDSSLRSSALSTMSQPPSAFAERFKPFLALLAQVTIAKMIPVGCLLLQRMTIANQTSTDPTSQQRSGTRQHE